MSIIDIINLGKKLSKKDREAVVRAWAVDLELEVKRARISPEDQALIRAMDKGRTGNTIPLRDFLKKVEKDLA